MALFVVATPIGNPQDLTLRAAQILQNADLVIGENRKVLRQILKAAGVSGKPTDELNEHSDSRDIEYFAHEASTKNVALVSDCGTPGFCDPGADLVAACVAKQIEVRPAPGPSSLMALLSVAGVRLDQFLFFGFLPVKAEARSQAIQGLKRQAIAFVILETPYRADTLIAELGTHFPKHHCVLGLDLTCESERVVRAKGSELARLGPYPKGVEPIVLVVPPF